LRDEGILTYRQWAWLVAGCHVKKWIFSLKMISDITAELQLPLSTLFSSVTFHDYVELLRKIKV